LSNNNNYNIHLEVLNSNWKLRSVCKSTILCEDKVKFGVLSSAITALKMCNILSNNSTKNYQQNKIQRRRTWPRSRCATNAEELLVEFISNIQRICFIIWLILTH